MEKLTLLRRAAALLAVLLLLCTGCASLRPLPDYRETGFEASLRWRVGELTVCADMTADKLSEGKHYALHFTAPDSLCGISVLVDGTQTRITCGEMQADGSLLVALVAHAELLLTEGTLGRICETEQDGQTRIYAEIKKEEKEVYEFYLDKNTGAPSVVCHGEKRLEVLSFTPTDE